MALQRGGMWCGVCFQRQVQNERCLISGQKFGEGWRRCMSKRTIVKPGSLSGNKGKVDGRETSDKMFIVT